MEFLLELIVYCMIGFFLGIGIIFLISILTHRSFNDTVDAIANEKKEKQYSEEESYWMEMIMMRQQWERLHDDHDHDDKDDKNDK